MSSIWNADGTTQQRGSARASGGGAQTHSIFGWADEKPEQAVSETRSQGMRVSAAGEQTRPAAGYKADDAAVAERKVNATKLKDIQGHNIFEGDDAPAANVHVHEKRNKDMQGSNIFELANEAVAKKEVSQNKSKELEGNSGIFGDASTGAAQSAPKSQHSSVRVRQPAGGTSTISFG
mmetsp:Transcript_22065/g.55561  ORF Transcript_22065/g.55561 Transcript_22065/m.55561 type:complete len:178 (-) Transcript_22065:166-699(-)|eukprot:jgi/Tetstr1/457589/TSEL_044157.t1